VLYDQIKMIAAHGLNFKHIHQYDSAVSKVYLLKTVTVTD